VALGVAGTVAVTTPVGEAVGVGVVMAGAANSTSFAIRRPWVRTPAMNTRSPRATPWVAVKVGCVAVADGVGVATGVTVVVGFAVGVAIMVGAADGAAVGAPVVAVVTGCVTGWVTVAVVLVIVMVMTWVPVSTVIVAGLATGAAIWFTTAVLPAIAIAAGAM